MATQYSKPAIEFQRSLAPGVRVALIDSGRESLNRWLRGVYGDGEIVLGDIIKQTANPDDCLYSATDSNGRGFECRTWWLRKCCRVVERLSPETDAASAQSPNVE